MLPRNFRKLSIDQRIAALNRAYGYTTAAPALATADIMIEAAIGYHSVPLGLVPNIQVNSQRYAVPMATEEPSVVAAQLFAANIVGRHGGVQSSAGAAIGIGQIFIRRCGRTLLRRINALRPRIAEMLKAEFASLRSRGGGMKQITLRRQRAVGAERQLALLEFTVDTVDAMGANRIILAAEAVAHWLKEQLRCDVIMAILSNDLNHAPSTATFCIPLTALRPFNTDPVLAAQRIAAAAACAEVNRQRALTHNKGIMNGICAVALATGNDTRSVEAAAHAYAARDGRYRPLSRYAVRRGALHAALAVPLPLATVGGATHTQRDAQQALTLLGTNRAADLKAIAAAIGLQQNFAALLALTGAGIARGHMPLQRRRQT